jgi:hypothetical protein
MRKKINKTKGIGTQTETDVIIYSLALTKGPIMRCHYPGDQLA